LIIELILKKATCKWNGVAIYLRLHYATRNYKLALIYSMSIKKRLIAVSACSWFQIGITISLQIILVPIYLSFWSVQTYGTWITIHTLISIFFKIDLWHQTFFDSDFLKIGQNNLRETGRHLWSGIWTGLIIGLFKVILIAIFLASGLFEKLLAEKTQLPPNLLKEAGILLLLGNIVWLLTGSAGGIFVRALTAFDYHPRLAGWGVFAAIITALTPAIAVTNGAGLLGAGIATASVTIIFYLFLYQDIFRLLHKENINYYKGSINLGYSNLVKSLVLSGKNLLENARNIGVKSILAPVAGARALVAFATIRTGANFTVQGLHSVINPLRPELMNLVHERDQERSETAFGTIWIFIVAVMAPGVVILQTVIEPLFTIWTRYKIEFNPLLFAILSVTMLIYAVAQPAIAVVSVNNLLKTRLVLSSAAAIVMIVGVLTLVPANWNSRGWNFAFSSRNLVHRRIYFCC
jgi:hypothetical protein